MKREVIKTYHPIGQGAFVSERHDNFNVVYDCGVDWPNRGSKYVNQLVKNSFKKGAKIDILFISHYDYDHISKIPILQANFYIKKIVLPLLTSDEKHLLVELYKGIGITEDIQNIINNPDDYFSDSQVIQVEPFTEEDITDAIIEFDELNDGQIKSGTKLRHEFWEYIPFNLEITNRRKQLEALLKAQGFDINELKTGFKYSERTRKKLKTIYEKLKGDINRNSMILYSGPFNSTNERIYFVDQICNFNFYHAHFSFSTNRISSIYTGDSRMSDYDLAKIYKNEFDKVILFQIPHHGDITSFDRSQLTNKLLIGPINFGSKNKYGHPSNNVVIELVKDNHHPRFVTENPNSIFIAKIEYDA